METQAPEFCNQTTGFCSNQEKRHSLDSKLSGDHFMVEDLLDFSKDDAVDITDAFDNVPGNSTDSSTMTIVDSCNSSRRQPCFNGGDFGSRNFDNDLCVPYDDLAELEWLSNFVEESFSSEDLQKLQLISGMKTRPPDESSETGNFQTGNHSNHHHNHHHSNVSAGGENTNDNNNVILHHEMSVPAKARSKRSRVAPCKWASRLLLVSSSSEEEKVTALAHHPNTGKKTARTPGPRRRDGGGENGVGIGEGRKCLHCAAEKTPQWRTGPLGPKTLCNACGVRYKSGRLVPEYRPAASPTFVLTKHSNSHRKVMELRRQKEMAGAQQQQLFLHHHHQNMVFDVSNGDDYLIHQPVGPDFRLRI